MHDTMPILQRREESVPREWSRYNNQSWCAESFVSRGFEGFHLLRS